MVRSVFLIRTVVPEKRNEIGSLLLVVLFGLHLFNDSHGYVGSKHISFLSFNWNCSEPTHKLHRSDNPSDLVINDDLEVDTLKVNVFSGFINSKEMENPAIEGIVESWTHRSIDVQHFIPKLNINFSFVCFNELG